MAASKNDNDDQRDGDRKEHYQFGYLCH